MYFCLQNKMNSCGRVLFYIILCTMPEDIFFLSRLEDGSFFFFFKFLSSRQAPETEVRNKLYRGMNTVEQDFHQSHMLEASLHC